MASVWLSLGPVLVAMKGIILIGSECNEIQYVGRLGRKSDKREIFIEHNVSDRI